MYVPVKLFITFTFSVNKICKPKHQVLVQALLGIG